MKKISVNIRITPSKLAKAIDGIKQYDSCFEPTSLAMIVTKALENGINATSHNLPIEPSAESMSIVADMTTQHSRKRSVPKGATKQRQQLIKESYALTGTEIHKRLESADPLTADIDTGSYKSIVDDFRPLTSEELEE